MRSRPSAVSRTQRTRRTRAFRRRPNIATGRTWELTLQTPRHTDRLGQAIGHSVRGGETLALFGPLGSGKTSLVRGIAAGLGAPKMAVTSPTFVFIHEYRGRLPLAHVDLYRVSSTREAESTGLEAYLTGSTVAVIEWADKGLSLLPPDRLEIELRHRTVGSRRIRLSATGPVSTALLAQTRRRYVHAARRPIARRLLPTKPKRKASP